MPWLELSINVPEGEDVSRYEDALLDAGALSVTLSGAADRPVLEPGPGETPLWEHTRVTGLFTEDADPAHIGEALRTALQLPATPDLATQRLEDQDWSRAWMDSYRPMRFGQRLWVCPDGYAPPDPDAVNLRLDPGLAFGTGTHPTTALCLEWLAGHDLQGLEVIDYGCGSGILAIAALLLGASRVWAVDNDPQALIAAHDNAEKNRVQDRITVLAPEHLPALQSDLLIANILAAPIVALAELFKDRVTPGGGIVLSGILQSQAAMVKAAYDPWFQMSEPSTREEWVRLEGLRK